MSSSREEAAAFTPCLPAIRQFGGATIYGWSKMHTGSEVDGWSATQATGSLHPGTNSQEVYE